MGFLAIVAFIALIYIAWSRENAARESAEMWNKAVKIAKHFGDKEIACFRFLKEKPAVWILVEFNYYHNEIWDLEKLTNSFKVDDCYQTDDKSLNKKDAEVMKLLSRLPYRISVFDATITYRQYQEACQKAFNEKFDNM